MFRLISFVLFLITTLTTYGQVGVNIRHTLSFSSDWKTRFASEMNNYQEISLNYWFRMPNKRIEFLPEVIYAANNYQYLEGTHEFRRIGVGLVGILYPLDLVGDCDCPTFSKQNGFFKKGWFIGISSHLGQESLSLDRESGDVLLDDKALFIRIGLTTGLDFGLNDLITLTPYWSYNRSILPSSYQDFFSNNVGGKLSELQLGLRAGFRFDYKR